MILTEESDSTQETESLEDTVSLNNKFASLSPVERIKALFDHVDEQDVLVTSSFGSTSVLLLHMLSKAKPDFPVHFIDTGYHFEETKAYRKLLEEQFKLRVIDVKAEERKHLFTRDNETWRYNQDLCCHINKVSPVDELKSRHKVWISGLLRFQNANRQKMEIFEKRKGIVKFHPVIDMTPEEVSLYMQIYDLPLHPLVSQGYDSVGCTHCTSKGNGRNGRWYNSTKTECGLHM